MNILTEFLKPNPVWTYICVHELGDWDRSVHLPPGFDVDRKNINVMNSNGIAADPRGVIYGFGGAIRTPASLTCGGQVKYLRDLKAMFPEVTVTHRSCMRVLVRVPGVVDAQECIEKFNHRSAALLVVGPIHISIEEGTIEFRNFPGTLDARDLLAVVTWCKDWLRIALGHLDEDPLELARKHAPLMPRFPDYVDWREVRYQETVHDGTVSKTDIQNNIRRILAEEVPHVQ